MKRRVILASASPRRRELLARIGVDFEVLVSESEERTAETEPAKVVVALAAEKARAVARMIKAEGGEAPAGTCGAKAPGGEPAAEAFCENLSAGVCTGDAFGKNAEKAACGGQTGASAAAVVSEESPTLVLGADTIVALDKQILGKPRDAADARQMLRELSGRSHHVLTGVCGIYLPEGRETAFFEETEVMVDKLSEAEIEAYIASGEPFDKAGAYGIQGLFSRHVRGIVGDYFNVVGFPLHSVYKTFFI